MKRERLQDGRRRGRDVFSPRGRGHDDVVGSAVSEVVMKLAPIYVAGIINGVVDSVVSEIVMSLVPFM